MDSVSQRVPDAMWFIGHRRMRSVVERFVDDEASIPERGRAVAHLRDCRGCLAGALFLVELRAALRRRRRRDPVMLAGAQLRRWALRFRDLEPWPTTT